MTGMHPQEARQLKPGQRVRFLGFGTPDPTPLPHGTEGTVKLIDGLGTVHVHWDNGAKVGIIVNPLPGHSPDRVARIG